MSWSKLVASLLLVLVLDHGDIQIYEYNIYIYLYLYTHYYCNDPRGFLFPGMEQQLFIPGLELKHGGTEKVSKPSVNELEISGLLAK